MDEKDIEQILGHDFSAGTEAFRDALLQRCLASLDAGDGGILLDDDDLDMLAAAGSPLETPDKRNGAI